MKTRKLGNLTVSEIGMGCMGFSHGYGTIPSEEYSIEAIQNACEHGCTFFDTAEVYSPNLSGIGHNELIVGKALKSVRENVVIATKLMLRGLGFGSVYKTIRSHLEGSLKRHKSNVMFYAVRNDLLLRIPLYHRIDILNRRKRRNLLCAVYDVHIHLGKSPATDQTFIHKPSHCFRNFLHRDTAHPVQIIDIHIIGL